MDTFSTQNIQEEDLLNTERLVSAAVQGSLDNLSRRYLKFSMKVQQVIQAANGMLIFCKMI